MVVRVEDSKLVQIGGPEDVEREKVEPVNVVSWMRGRWQSGVEEIGTALVVKSAMALRVLVVLARSQSSEPKKLPMSLEKSSEARMS